MKRIRIVSPDGMGPNTRVEDADTGELIENVFAIDVRLRAKGWNVAVIEVHSVEVDVVARVDNDVDGTNVSSTDDAFHPLSDVPTEWT